ncbi:uncharacterized protein KGF55_002033 [Candida pseudojiufengensis]|uniref:uncharacterized protein n=1 Tax=Candida pseudojiufengensis TaxID=497109 RepID=UPI0022249523|nr:uncharacterized protein KGF55_002033 [Candida pseudojiufengensis]KAI5964091.1 hypothetical protein KGF55_002033 [Candida pseudojiufengensis]
MTNAKVKVKKFLDKFIQPQYNYKINQSDPNFNPYDDSSRLNSLKSYGQIYNQSDLEEIPSLSYSSFSNFAKGEPTRTTQDMTSIKPSSIVEPSSPHSDLSSVEEVINYNSYFETNEHNASPKPNYPNNRKNNDRAHSVKRNIINNSFAEFLNNLSTTSSINSSLKNTTNNRELPNDDDTNYDNDILDKRLDLSVDEEEEDFSSAIKVDKFRFSTRGTLLNYKRGKCHPNSGSDSSGSTGKNYKNGVGQFSKSYRKRRTTRRRSENIKFNSSEFHFTEEEEFSKNGHDYDLGDNASLVSITTTATVATTTTTTTTTTTANANVYRFTNMTSALSSTSVFESTNTAMGAPGSPILPLDDLSLTNKTTTHTRKTRSYQRTTTKKKRKSTSKIQSSSSNKRNGHINRRNHISPNTKTNQPTFSKQGTSTHAYRDIERIFVQKDGSNLGHEVESESTTEDSLVQHHQVELGIKTSSCVIKDSPMTASFSSHASIKDNESNFTTDHDHYDLNYFLNHLSFDSDDNRKSSQSDQEDARSENETIQEIPHSGDTRNGYLTEVQDSAALATSHNDEQKWFVNVKYKFHNYYSKKFKKIKLHKRNSENNKPTETTNKDTKVTPVSLHSNDATSNESRETRNSDATIKLNNSKSQKETAKTLFKQPSGSQNMQPLFYSLENKQSSNLNLMQKSKSLPDLPKSSYKGTELYYENYFKKDEFKLSNGQKHSREIKEAKEELLITAESTKIKGEDLTGAIYYIQNEQKADVIKQMTFLNGSQQNLVTMTNPSFKNYRSQRQPLRDNKFSKLQTLQNLKQINNHSFYKNRHNANGSNLIYRIIGNEFEKVGNCQHESPTIPKIVESEKPSSCSESLHEYSPNDGDDEQSFNEIESRVSI